MANSQSFSHQRLYEAVTAADCWEILGGPLLGFYQRGRYGEVMFHDVPEYGGSATYIFEKWSFYNATIDERGIITLPDHTGAKRRLVCYKLIPAVLPKGEPHWVRLASRTRLTIKKTMWAARIHVFLAFLRLNAWMKVKAGRGQRNDA
ncbi:hypothetical protein ACHHRT_12695 [Desulfurivibrio sp. D14AmB]|uniref:hypothetical protein n=1 Tax=Desulfurivibrio sp. D14AmB TaxID=3374370 RepID=UPI00376F2DF5